MRSDEPTLSEVLGVLQELYLDPDVAHAVRLKSAETVLKYILEKDRVAPAKEDESLEADDNKITSLLETLRGT